MPHIFISYQRDDTDFAELLKRELDQAGFTSWIDAERLRAGKSWRAAIDTAIQEAEALIVIMTPSAKKSEYVTYEWAFALGAGKPVILLLRKSTPLHPRLEDLQYLDFSSGYRWADLMKELEHIQSAAAQPTASTNSNTPATFTIPVPDHAPPYLKQAVAALDSASASQRSNAIHTLAQINSPEAHEILVALLKHPLLDIALGSAFQLANLGDQRSIPILLQNIAMTDPNVVGPGQLGIWALRDLAILPLTSILNDTSDIVVPNERFGSIQVPIASVAAEALEQISTPEALAAVEEWRKQQEDAKT